MHPKFTQLPLVATIPEDPRNRICEICGKAFRRSLGYLRSAEVTGRPARYCSRACRYEAQRTRVALTCDACGRPFLRHRSEIAKAANRGYGKHTYCSNQCANAERSSGNRECTCEECGILFTVWASAFTYAEKAGTGAGRFCSALCRDVFMAKARSQKRTVYCLTCGETLKRQPALIKTRNFCSPKCMGAHVHTWTRCGYYGVGGTRPDLGQYFRSRWEANIARVLTALGHTWEYEPRTFACENSFYTPDFLVSESYWIEVKGWLTPLAESKIKAFGLTYPSEPLVIIDRAMYRVLQHEWEPRIPEWEHSAT